MSHNFIKSVTTHHGEGNAHIDLVELDDGRCIAIDSDAVVLFPSREAFENPDTDASNFPTWPLWSEDWLQRAFTKGG